jgi:hypothetical protein
MLSLDPSALHLSPMHSAAKLASRVRHLGPYQNLTFTGILNSCIVQTLAIRSESLDKRLKGCQGREFSPNDMYRPVVHWSFRSQSPTIGQGVVFWMCCITRKRIENSRLTVAIPKVGNHAKLVMLDGSIRVKSSVVHNEFAEMYRQELNAPSRLLTELPHTLCQSSAALVMRHCFPHLQL